MHVPHLWFSAVGFYWSIVISAQPWKLRVITSGTRWDRYYCCIYRKLKYVPSYQYTVFPGRTYWKYMCLVQDIHTYNFLKPPFSFLNWTLALNISWKWDLLPNISACLGIIRLIRWPETVHLVDRGRCKLTDINCPHSFIAEGHKARSRQLFD